MKTNQIMSRPMGQFSVEQRTKDGFFNATGLLKQWNLEAKYSTDIKKRDLDNFWKLTGLDAFMSEVAENELNIKSVDSTELKNALSTTSRGKYSNGTWMHPILFIKFAMWLSPRFEYQVIKFVYDQMIKYRNEAGDAYRELSSAVSTIVPKTFMPQAMSKIGEAINYVVFGKHEKMMRNKNASEESMRELFELEHRIAENINDGLIKSYDDIINSLRIRYSNKYYPKVFINK